MSTIEVQVSASSAAETSSSLVLIYVIGTQRVYELFWISFANNFRTTWQNSFQGIRGLQYYNIFSGNQCAFVFNATTKPSTTIAMVILFKNGGPCLQPLYKTIFWSNLLLQQSGTMITSQWTKMKSTESNGYGRWKCKNSWNDMDRTSYKADIDIYLNKSNDQNLMVNTLKNWKGVILRLREGVLYWKDSHIKET